jgi:AraC-like DNA-binding protein
MLLFIQGDANIVIESSSTELTPYDFLIIKPTQYHFLTINSPKTYERFRINFPAPLVEDYLLPVLGQQNQLYHLASRNDITGLFFSLLKLAPQCGEEDKKILFKSFLNELIIRIKHLDGGADSGLKSLSPVITSITNYINDNISENLNSKKIANALFISESYLHHLFSKFFRIGVMSYIRNKKVLNAQSLIRAGVKPTKACVQCGFADYATFYRSYKKILGITPNENAR